MFAILDLNCWPVKVTRNYWKYTRISVNSQELYIWHITRSEVIMDTICETSACFIYRFDDILRYGNGEGCVWMKISTYRYRRTIVGLSMNIALDGDLFPRSRSVVAQFLHQHFDIRCVRFAIMIPGLPPFVPST